MHDASPRSTDPTQLPLLTVAADTLRPLIISVVEETLARLEKARADMPADRLAYSEEEAAALLGLKRWQLRDERYRGRIQASQIVRGRYAYQREDLIRYLALKRVNGTEP
jgi:hypothetical protein